MFGSTEWLLIPVLVITLIAVATDLLFTKVFNWLTVSGFFLGLIVHWSLHGFEGVKFALSGASLAFILLFPLFIIRLLGAGDVKYLMAIGSWMGPSLISQSIVLGFCAGAVFSIIALITKKRLIPFLQTLFFFIFTLLSKAAPLESPQFKEKTKIPFALSLGVGVIWVALDSPLRGMWLWH